MKDFDFDKLKNIEIPDTWVSNAMNVPPKPHFVTIFVKKVLPIAAMFILVLTLSFFVFYLVSDDSIKTAPQGVVNNTVNSDNSNIADTKSEPQASNTQIDEAESETQVQTQTNTQSDIKETQSKPEKPQKPTKSPTDDNDPNSSAPKPGQSQGSNPSSKPSGNPQPTTKPSVSVDPTEAPTLPTEKPVKPQEMISCKGVFSESLLKGCDEVYFSIRKLDMNDYEVDVETETKKYPVTDIEVKDNKVYAKYYPSTQTQIIQSGKYVFCFYNNQGEVVYTDFININL